MQLRVLEKYLAFHFAESNLKNDQTYKKAWMGMKSENQEGLILTQQRASVAEVTQPTLYRRQKTAQKPQGSLDLIRKKIVSLKNFHSIWVHIKGWERKKTLLECCSISFLNSTWHLFINWVKTGSKRLYSNLKTA